MLTGTQRGILQVLGQRKADGKAGISAAELGWHLSPRLAGIAVTSACRALERRSLVGRIPPDDRWSTAKWFALSTPPQKKTEGEV